MALMISGRSWEEADEACALLRQTIISLALLPAFLWNNN